MACETELLLQTSLESTVCHAQHVELGPIHLTPKRLLQRFSPVHTDLSSSPDPRRSNCRHTVMIWSRADETWLGLSSQLPLQVCWSERPCPAPACGLFKEGDREGRSDPEEESRWQARSTASLRQSSRHKQLIWCFSFSHQAPAWDDSALDRKGAFKLGSSPGFAKAHDSAVRRS